jgi:PhzF family phenazine biosynthesis protein
MRLRLFQVDAFTERVFGGNPAAVVPLEHWLSDALMQRIAVENNLSETAFFVARDGGYEIRWFTPAVEIALCGHATLAAAHVIASALEPGAREVRFASRSGPLGVSVGGGWLTLDFPADGLAPVPAAGPAARALGAAPREVHDSRFLLAVFEDEATVRALKPDLAAVAGLHHHGVIATAPGDACDFVSRVFAPRIGVPEDPVTGSAHCALTPYWARRLGKATLDARQVSVRGGALRCSLAGGRVHIGGRAATYLDGWIDVGEAHV